jgi:hypothetical protein
MEELDWENDAREGRWLVVEAGGTKDLRSEQGGLGIEWEDGRG